MALDDITGVQLPGASDEQFNYGLDYRGLADGDSAIPGMPSQVLPSDFNMGAVSMPVGLMTDTDSQFGDIPLFNDPDPTTNNESMFDSMAQLPTDSHVEVLANESMYAAATPLPFSPIAETAEPLLEPAETSSEGF